jgi:hypothetical protein
MHNLWSQTITPLDDDADSITTRQTSDALTIKIFQVLLLAKQAFGAALQAN